MDVLEKFSSFYTDLSSMQIENLASIYSPDVVFIDPIAEHKGLSAVESYFDRLLKNAKHCQFVIHSQLEAVPKYTESLVELQQSRIHTHDNSESSLPRIVNSGSSHEKIDTRKCVVNWTMEYKTPKINKGEAIRVDGVSLLTLHGDMIVFHRDYYDLGQMVYENVPLLGRIIKRIKRGMA
jgi:hypothetical protein